MGPFSGVAESAGLRDIPAIGSVSGPRGGNRTRPVSRPFLVRGAREPATIAGAFLRHHVFREPKEPEFLRRIVATDWANSSGVPSSKPTVFRGFRRVACSQAMPAVTKFVSPFRAILGARTQKVQPKALVFKGFSRGDKV